MKKILILAASSFALLAFATLNYANTNTTNVTPADCPKASDVQAQVFSPSAPGDSNASYRHEFQTKSFTFSDQKGKPQWAQGFAYIHSFSQDPTAKLTTILSKLSLTPKVIPSVSGMSFCVYYGNIPDVFKSDLYVSINNPSKSASS